MRQRIDHQPVPADDDFIVQPRRLAVVARGEQLVHHLCPAMRAASPTYGILLLARRQIERLARDDHLALCVLMAGESRNIGQRVKRR